MKKMEFMRAAAKEIIDFFEELYLENEYTSQTISLKKQQGSFKIRDSGGTLSFYVYKTGTISYNCSSFVGTKCDYKEYYVFNADDDHNEVLLKLRSDLRKLKDYFSDIFMSASFEDNPFYYTIFEYGKPFETTLTVLESEDE